LYFIHLRKDYNKIQALNSLNWSYSRMNNVAARIDKYP
jgi:hypothetical protein